MDGGHGVDGCGDPGGGEGELGVTATTKAYGANADDSRDCVWLR